MLIAGERYTQRWMNHVQQRNTDEEVPLLGRQLGNQALDEVMLDIARTGRKLIDGGNQVAALLNGGNRQLQAQRPAFSDVVQVHAAVRIDA
ncbi:hypothetical protein D3C76_1190310 [compost metagenome]